MGAAFHAKLRISSMALADGNMGVWRPVYLAAVKSVKLRSPMVVTTFPSTSDLSHADLAVAAELTNLVCYEHPPGLSPLPAQHPLPSICQGAKEVAATFTGTIAGTNITFSKVITLEANETLNVVVNASKEYVERQRLGPPHPRRIKHVCCRSSSLPPPS